MQSFDSLFDKYGQFTRYQILLTAGICILGAWLVPSVSINFTAGRMDHWCDVSQYSGRYNLSEQQVRELVQVRGEDGQVDKCHIYNLDELVLQNQTHVIACTQWQFDRTVFQSTIVSKYNLVCDREWLVAVSSAILISGISLGGLSSGFFADRFGRLKVIICYLFFQTAGGMLSAFAPSFTVFVVARVILGLGNSGTWICGIVLMVEEVGPKWRPTVAVGMNFAYSLGVMFMCLVAFLVRSTVYFQLALVLPSFAYFSFWWLYAESPRWLLVVDQYKKAKTSLIAMFPKEFKKDLEKLDVRQIVVEKKKTSSSWLKLFHSKKLALGTIILHYAWLSISLVWYALALNSAFLKGNIFLVTFLMSLAEIPAAILCTVMCRWRVTGRKYTCILSIMLAGVCGIVCVPLLHYEYDLLVTSLSMLGKLGASMGWSSLYVFSAELYPTEVRNSAMGSSSFCAYISGVIGSFVGGPMRRLWPPLPYVVYGFLGMTSSLACFYLPETLDMLLCDTVEDAAEHGFVKNANVVVEQDVDLNTDLLEKKAPEISSYNNNNNSGI